MPNANNRNHVSPSWNFLSFSCPKYQTVIVPPHHLPVIFAQLIGKRDQSQSNFLLQIDYDNIRTLFIIIILTCAQGCRIYKSEIAKRQLLSFGSLQIFSMSRRKQSHPKHIENEHHVFLDNNDKRLQEISNNFITRVVC
eukprot:XP_014789931.1 PREDICTED: uncharacterized protein LOC106883434 [Octopus bimaculoides]